MTDPTDQHDGTPRADEVVQLDRFDGSADDLWSRWNRLWCTMEPAPESATAGGEALAAGKHGTFSILVRVSDDGIARGGRLVIGPRTPETTRHEPFQSNRADESGYVSARGAGEALPVRCLTDAEKISLVVVEFPGGAAAGDTVEVTLGDTSKGGPGWTAPHRSQAHAGFLVAIDRDGSGRFRRLRDVPGIEVKPALATGLRGWLSGPEESGGFCITVLAEDGFGNPVPLRRSSVTVRDEFFSTFVPELDETESKTLRVRGLDLQSGSFDTIRIAGPGNKVDVPTPPADFLKDLRIVFGDLRTERRTCDGHDIPEAGDLDDALRWAAEVEGLDFCALAPTLGAATPGDDLETRWSTLLEVVGQRNRPGRFLTLPGYQWNEPSRYGRHLVVFGDEAAPRPASPAEGRSSTLEKLCALLQPSGPLVVPCPDGPTPSLSSAAYRMHPAMFPVMEVFGSGAATGGAHPLEACRVALEAGLGFGVIGSSGTTIGRPGLVPGPDGTPQRPGLCAVVVDRLDRTSLLKALRHRRCYAVSGRRILLDVRLNDATMGELVEAEFIERHISVRTWAERPVARIDIIKNGQVIHQASGKELYETTELRDYIVQAPLDWYVVRVTLDDGSLALSSPIRVRQLS